MVMRNKCPERETFFRMRGTPKIVAALFVLTVRTLVKQAMTTAELNIGVKRTHQSWINITTPPITVTISVA